MPIRTRPIWLLVAIAVSVLSGCSGVRHPLDDSETRPDSAEIAVEEAETSLDEIGDAVMGDTTFSSDRWSGGNGCATAPFAPSQGDVGMVLIRVYRNEAVDTLGPTTRVLDDFEAYWEEQGESVSRSSPDMDPGVVARVHGIGYELVAVPPDMELRAFIPCY